MIIGENVTNEIITLLVDRIEKYCFMSGANNDSSWRETNKGRHIWIFDRIDRLIYHKTFSSDDAFDHSISVRWKKPIGRGEKNPADILKGMMDEYDGLYLNLQLQEHSFYKNNIHNYPFL